jgi:hypothetical protein
LLANGEAMPNAVSRLPPANIGHEIRALFKVTADGHPYSGMLRLALLTGQRLERLRTLRYSDIRDGIWHQRLASKRMKNVPKDLRLGAMALEMIEAQRQKRFEGSDWVLR